MKSLVNTKWKFKDTLVLDNHSSYFIEFTSDSGTFEQLEIAEAFAGSKEMKYHHKDESMIEYPYSTRNGWTNAKYNSINIVGGADVNNAKLISFLQANATEIRESKNVTLEDGSVDLHPYTKYSNLLNDNGSKYTGVEDLSNKIQKEQELQDKKIKNAEENIARIDGLIHTTTVVKVKESYDGAGFSVPKTARVEGIDYEVVDNQPFEVSKITGQTLNITQLVQKLGPSFWAPNGHNTFEWRDNEVDVIGNAGSGEGLVNQGGVNTLYLVKGHKYLYTFMGKTNTTSVAIFMQIDNRQFRMIDVNTSAFTRASRILAFENVSDVLYIYTPATSSKYENLFTVKDLMIIDLTLMFGAGNEPESDADSRLTSIISSYIPYNRGTLTDSTVKNVSSVGANRFNISKLTGGTKVVFNGINCYKYTDGDHNFKYYDVFEKGSYALTFKAYRKSGSKVISIGVKYTDETIEYLVLTPNAEPKTLITNPQKQIAFITGRPAFYEETYIDLETSHIEKGSVPSTFKVYIEGKTIDFDTVLAGAGTVGDELIVTKNAKGLYDVSLIKRMAEVDLGALVWGATGAEHTFNSASLKNTIKPAERNNAETNIVCSSYSASTADGAYGGKDLSIGVSGDGTLYVRNNAVNSPSELVPKLSGVILVYELETPLPPEVIATDLTLDQISVLGQQGGDIKVNQIEDGIVTPKTIETAFDIKYWIKGGTQ